MTPNSQWNADPAKRTVGTLMLKLPNGGDIDLIANNSIRSGKIAAYLEMRDKVLVAGADPARRDRRRHGAARCPTGPSPARR